MTLAAIAVAAAAGAVARYLLDRLIQQRTEAVFPLGTLTVNITGSAALGFLTGLALYHGLAPAPPAIIGTGFVGSYTTFSTFTYETVRLIEDGATPRRHPQHHHQPHRRNRGHGHRTHPRGRPGPRAERDRRWGGGDLYPAGGRGRSAADWYRYLRGPRVFGYTFQGVATKS
ncbi:MAG: fluoride efflux transporter CrcB [Acidimicrobiales bacterium]